MLTLDTAEADRLKRFCRRLPTLPSDRTEAEQELRFTWACLSQRRAEAQAAMVGSGYGHEAELLRYELGAIDSAKTVLSALWRRQFSSELKLE